ncbi:MAG: pseudouridine synthase, RluA family [Bacilli bacterium]|nr:pseudouridine synthase, RluA family [Bacilli bacterium]
MSKQTRFTITESNELMKWLQAQFPEKGRNAIKALLSHRQVSVGGQVITQFNHPLQQGQEVVVEWSRIVEEEPVIGLTILYEDAELIVIEKQAGLLSVATDDEKELTAYRQLTEHVRRKDAKNRIFVVHRLDRDTSGVMMFAKSEPIQQKLQTEWRETVSERVYIAIVEGKIRKSEGTITSWLKESKTLKMYSSRTPNDGQEAITHYKTLKTSANCSLLEIRLETGRKNQIRVHMQDIGHPIMGDKKYGAVRNTLGRLGLHASILAFIHPVTGKQMHFESKTPEKFTRLFQN